MGCVYCQCVSLTHDPPRTLCMLAPQALITALGLPRSEAREALKHAQRLAAAAFLSELHRVPLETHCLDELAWEYALSR